MVRVTHERPAAIAPTRAVAALIAVVAAFGPSGCTCGSSCGADAPATGAATSASASASSASASASASATDDGVKPVYPVGGPPHPLATRLCGMLYGRVEAARAACCKQPSPSPSPSPSRLLGNLEAECSRMLAAALHEAAATVDAAKLDACEAALAVELEPCDWMTRQRPELPAACRDLVDGALPAGKRCRSSLECATGLACRGVGPTQAGTCAPPGKQGAACGLAIDALASYVESTQRARHPECEGFCERRLCVSPVAVGGACKSALECEPDAACDKGKCAKVGAAPLADGALCVEGRCAPGLACVAGRCAKKKAKGEACTTSAECRAACVTPKLGAPGTCDTQCGP